MGKLDGSSNFAGRPLKPIVGKPPYQLKHKFKIGKVYHDTSDEVIRGYYGGKYRDVYKTGYHAYVHKEDAVGACARYHWVAECTLWGIIAYGTMSGKLCVVGRHLSVDKCVHSQTRGIFRIEVYRTWNGDVVVTNTNVGTDVCTKSITKHEAKLVIDGIKEKYGIK
jgi:hypothetical protein